MDKPVVVKVGGALLENATALQNLLGALQTMQQSRPVVLVHGGGNGVEQLMQQLGLKTEKHQGLRVTPDEHMPIITGALAGTANKAICAAAYALQVNTVGLSLFDGNSVKCEVLSAKLQAVGTPSPDQPQLLQSLLAAKQLPVISSIGCDPSGRLLNVNADQAATAIAQLLNADLYLLSDVPGVLDGDKQLISSLTQVLATQLIQDGVIQAGMLVKVYAAQTAATTLGHGVTIGDWSTPDALVQHASTNNKQNYGTYVHAVSPQQEVQL